MPSPVTMKDAERRVHAPPSSRYEIESGGEVPLTSAKVTLTAEVYQFAEPSVPSNVAVELSRLTPLTDPFRTAKEFGDSTLPATSAARKSTVWEPFSSTVNSAV